MSKGPGLFSDIGKKAKDLLTRDYNSDQKLNLSTYSAGGVALTSSTVKKGGFTIGDVATQYKHKSFIIDVKVDMDSNITTTFTFTEVLPSTKTIASFKFPDYNSGKLEVQYFHDHATVTTAIAPNQSPTLDLTVTIGTQGIAIGGEAGYETTTGSFTKYTAGISVTKPDSCALIILDDKGDSIKASYVHHLDSLKKTTVVVSGKINKDTLCLLVKVHQKLDLQDAVVSFPLYTEALKFARHGEKMIQIAVRALTLNIYNVSNDMVYQFMTTSPISDYFSDLIQSLKEQCFHLDVLVNAREETFT